MKGRTATAVLPSPAGRAAGRKPGTGVRAAAVGSERGSVSGTARRRPKTRPSALPSSHELRACCGATRVADASVGTRPVSCETARIRAFSSSRTAAIGGRSRGFLARTRSRMAWSPGGDPGLSCASGRGACDITAWSTSRRFLPAKGRWPVAIS